MTFGLNFYQFDDLWMNCLSFYSLSDAYMKDFESSKLSKSSYDNLNSDDILNHSSFSDIKKVYDDESSFKKNRIEDIRSGMSDDHKYWIDQIKSRNIPAEKRGKKGMKVFGGK